jgi:geranylgeranyl diphosphate synthase type I
LTLNPVTGQIELNIKDLDQYNMEKNYLTLAGYIEIMLPAIEKELKQAISPIQTSELSGLYKMFTYHLGWEGEGAGPEARGKRIRPLLSLLTNAASGGTWQKALPAAAAVELVHNFSLIHDDIEDNSPLRRGRPTVWKKWGIAQATNTGDAMLTLAHLSILRLTEVISTSSVLQATELLQSTCLHLTQGQFLDISFEARGDLNLDAYWSMVSGKTAALLSACAELGALVANASEECRVAFRAFGRALGLAFQAQDDLLGIWGNSALTGKSAESDLVAGKKSLPVLYGLSQKTAFFQRWEQGGILANEVPALAELLKAEGAYDYTQEAVRKLTGEALEALEHAQPQGDAGQALYTLAEKLVARQQ